MQGLSSWIELEVVEVVYNEFLSREVSQARLRAIVFSPMLEKRSAAATCKLRLQT